MSTLLQRDQTPPSLAELSVELQRLFGFERFLASQEAVVSQVMAGVDALAVMPTGAGKSLCYQFPSMLLPGVTLVISPLIALMKDQYDSLPADVYERTTFVNSTLEADTLTQRIDEIVAGKYKLVYCAPERLRNQAFVDALRRAGLSLLVVDEAHCVSMWGHDFRPDYLFIGKVLPRMGHPILLALTATATPEMQTEIAAQLGRDLKPVVASTFRPNLYYEVEELADKEQKMRRLLEICKEERGSGVVYARSRESCEQLAAMLRRDGIQAAHYHAGMEGADRTRAQESFMLDRTRVIVATIAFGMGIDKGNVRFIVHFSPPDSLEGYIQESGRAGRDGRPSRCVLLMAPGDKSNMTRWKRQEQMKVDDLRAVYREVARQVPAGATVFVNLEELAASMGQRFDSTQLRVALSLLERVGLIVRHADSPRLAALSMTQAGAQMRDPELLRFQEAAFVPVGEQTRRDVVALSTNLGVTPPEMERLLLSWAEQGWITYRGDRRGAVLERLVPPKDVADVINRMLERQDDAQQHQIKQVMDYVGRSRCRHQMLAAHLGETIEECGTSCDYCAPPEGRAGRDTQAADAPDLPDNPGQVIVECLRSFPFSAGKPSLARALVGSAASNVKADRVRHFGALAGANASAIERAVDELVEGGYLEYYESDGYRLLAVTEQGADGVPRDAVTLKPKKQKKQGKADRTERREQRRSFYAGERQVSAPEARFEDRESTPEEADLFERLRAWRRVVANRLGLPPYVIFHDKTLWAIALAHPTNDEELLNVKGVGQSHVAKYGADLLQLVSEGD